MEYRTQCLAAKGASPLNAPQPGSTLAHVECMPRSQSPLSGSCLGMTRDSTVRPTGLRRRSHRGTPSPIAAPHSMPSRSSLIFRTVLMRSTCSIRHAFSEIPLSRERGLLPGVDPVAPPFNQLAFEIVRKGFGVSESGVNLNSRLDGSLAAQMDRCPARMPRQILTRREEIACDHPPFSVRQ